MTIRGCLVEEAQQTGKTRLRGSSIFDKVLYCVFCASDNDYKASSCNMKEFATLIVLPCIQDRDLYKSDRDAYRKTKIKPAVGKPMWLWHELELTPLKGLHTKQTSK